LVDYDFFCGVSPQAAEEAAPAEITAARLHDALLAGRTPLLLDVREPWEYAIAHLNGARLIPLDDLWDRFPELEPGQEIVTICHHGSRSQAARDFLVERGFARVSNLTGGIDAWAREVEPGMRRY
jgi:adenylyltransferase/sulfurtransferase